MKKAIFGTVLLGVGIGVLNLAHYFTTKHLSGVETPFGLFPGGFPAAILMGASGKRLSPDLVAVIILGAGILGGSILGAVFSGDLTVTRFRERKLSSTKAVRAVLGGALMGVGVWMAQGCLIKHALSGAPGLMLSSYVTLMGIVAGIWISAVIEERQA